MIDYWSPTTLTCLTPCALARLRAVAETASAADTHGLLQHSCSDSIDRLSKQIRRLFPDRLGTFYEDGKVNSVLLLLVSL